MKFTKIIFCVLFIGAFISDTSAQDKTISDVCPVLEISAPPAAVESGETMTFAAKISGEFSDITYMWSVDKGEIVSGQGTASISVSTEGLEDEVVTATVELMGVGLPGCETIASESGIVTIKPKAILYDQFTRGYCEGLLQRMDSFFMELQNQPDAQGYIIIYGNEGATRVADWEARNWIKYRGFPAERIVITKGGGSVERAEVEWYLVPQGAQPPALKPQTEDVREPENLEKYITKPYIFSQADYDSVGGCGNLKALDWEGYAETLKANPKSRSNIVLKGIEKEQLPYIKEDFLSFLAEKGIARKRIRFFSQESGNGVELWVLP